MDIAGGDLGRWPATKQKPAPVTAAEGDLKIENVAGDIRGPEIEKSPASAAVKAAPITCTLDFAWVISTLGGIPSLNIQIPKAVMSAVVSAVPVVPSTFRRSIAMSKKCVQRFPILISLSVIPGILRDLAKISVRADHG